MIDKQAIFEEARALMRQWYPTLNGENACLYWTQVAMRTLLAHGLNPILQAGSLHWNMNDNPDPTVPTCWGYQWEPNQEPSRSAIAAGLLPEIHIWCGLKATNEIVDFSTGYHKDVAVNQFGFTWTTPDPTLYVWGPPPSNALYIPNYHATHFAWAFILEKQCGIPRSKIYAAA